MGREQVLRAFGDGGLERFVGGFGITKRGLQFLVRPPRRAYQHRDQHQDQRGAGEIDPQQDGAGTLRIRPANGQQPLLLGG